MIRFTRRAAALGIVVVLATLSHAEGQTTQPTLYTRLGGYDAIAAVVDDFVPRIVADAELAHFFGGHGTDSQMRLRQLIVDQLCQASGGPCVYIGRSMKAAHGGLGITEANWTKAVNHLVVTLNKFKVPAKEQEELLGIATSLKKDIVEK